ncbi:MAG TPA: FAD-binding oxidoreductase [Anaeromyxobacteraceae bacterium]|nr:FAD-binding oxidoreductase [Anaeromyxobacteraceae bacterium]
MPNGQPAHEQKVARVARQLREHASGRPLRIRKRATPHEVPKARDLRYSDDTIDTSDLDQILSIDPVARVCVAEPGVTFVDLVAATLPHGLVPLVVPELKTITIGGAVSGCSLESTSFRFGGFHDGCLEYEVITARGDVLVCTPENEHRLLFQMLHGSFGTLGVLTRLTFRLLPAKPFVHVVYERHRTLAGYQAAILRHSEAADVDFMDGIIHSPTEWALCLGRLVDRAPYTHRYDWTRVYYRTTRTRAEDYLRTPDYFFRYDHGVTNVHPKTFLGRLLFGKALDSERALRLYRLLTRVLPAGPPRITVDVFIPFSRMEAFMEWYRPTFGHFPLWCVPFRPARAYEWLHPRIFDGLRDTLFVDLAIYGMRQPPGINLHKALEEKLLELGGLKTLISHNYYSPEDFWKTWNRDNYARVKAQTDPDNVFRDLYDKTCLAARGLTRPEDGDAAAPPPPPARSSGGGARETPTP